MGFTWTVAEARQAHQHAQAAKKAAVKTGKAFQPKFLTDHEYKTVRVLVDMIIPKDERSGSATDAGVAEFIDFMMMDLPPEQRSPAGGFVSSDEQRTVRQTAMRGGLTWLDVQCNRRFNRTFLGCTEAQRKEVIDDIAWPAKARPEMTHGVAFFNSLRDLTATGFWTSKIGIEDLDYQGNVFVAEWEGCPEEALKKLGVKYEAD
ncbi:MAG TPA: gluconate 2-dehydrogenase subunit 3 family protein [Acidobacteriota bacterium]